MNRGKVTYCSQTKKFCYSSEAKANRAKNRYEDIRRVYHCEHCGNWHTTSMGTGLAVQEGIIKKTKPKKEVTPDQIQARIDQLKGNDSVS